MYHYLAIGFLIGFCFGMAIAKLKWMNKLERKRRGFVEGSQYRLAWKIKGTNKIEKGEYFPSDPRYSYHALNEIARELNYKYPDLFHWVEVKR